MQHIAYVDTHVGVDASGDIEYRNHLVYVYEGKRAAVGVYKPVPGKGPNGEWEAATAPSGELREAAKVGTDRSERLLH